MGKKKPGPPTAHATVPSLVRTLSRQGWGPLYGRAMKGRANVLRALSDAVVDDQTGEGSATLWQLAQHAGMSKRHLQRCLHTLEDLGLVIWWRGGIIKGKRIPSRFRVVKTVLVKIIKDAWRTMNEKTKAHLAAEEKRLTENGPRQTHRLTNQRREPRPDAEKQGDITAHLHTSKEGGNNTPPSKGFIPLTTTHPADAHAIKMADINAHERVKQAKFYGVDVAFMADASVSGDNNEKNHDPLAILAAINPEIAGRVSRRRAARERKKQRCRL